MTDPRKLKPGELCSLLNSTPLGEVITPAKARHHRVRAGLRIGDAQRIDLLRYAAWLAQQRHSPRADASQKPDLQLEQAARGAAALESRTKENTGHGQKLTGRQELVIAALLTEPTYAAAASKAGICETTLYRWLKMPSFRTAYRQARRTLVDSAIGRIQTAAGHGVDALVYVAKHGRKDADRVRASVALLDHALRGLADADMLHGDRDTGDAAPLDTENVVKILASRLQQVSLSELSTTEKARLSAILSDSLIKAIGVDVLDKRLEALQSVLLPRKDKK
jgi:hypothetical protein